jgi:hypothetical protein
MYYWICRLQEQIDWVLTIMAVKRKIEFDDVSSITEEALSANVYGRIVELSPLKTSRKNEKLQYFDCKITNGKKYAAWYISFEPKVWPEIEGFVE